MATNLDIEWTRGQTEEWTLTILDAAGNPDDLSDATAVEFEVKPYDGGADPATLHLDQAAGITIRAQTGANVGVCDLVATKDQTFALAEGTWHYDVWVTRSDTSRRRALYGKLLVDEVVNFP